MCSDVDVCRTYQNTIWFNPDVAVAKSPHKTPQIQRQLYWWSVSKEQYNSTSISLYHIAMASHMRDGVPNQYWFDSLFNSLFGLTTQISCWLSEISRSCLHVSLTFLHFHRLLQFSAFVLVEQFSTSRNYYRSLWSRLKADRLICLPSFNGDFQS